MENKVMAYSVVRGLPFYVKFAFFFFNFPDAEEENARKKKRTY